MAGQKTESRRSTLFGAHDQDADEQERIVDFKMVTFSLGGKDYGVDIMKVKEIAKFENFTYVPNTQPFVIGVYNLRGDIISVIDMRTMFNLPARRHADGQTEDGLILRLDSGLIGVVVDRIDRVAGISSESIQPPHPIFADINLKYISGVVEYDGRLYIILDVERVLGDSADVPHGDEPTPALGDSVTGGELPAGPVSTDAIPDSPAVTETTSPAEMLAPTLATLSGFHMSELNRNWVDARMQTWQASHDGAVRITTQEEVDEFLAPFASPYTSRFWEDDHIRAVRSLLSEKEGGNVNVWNPGCGQGYEAYSIACVVRSAYPGSRLKVWASDNDLLSISTAPNLTFDARALPDFYEPYVTEGTKGLGFAADIRQGVLFEFSDVTHQNAVPVCDLIVIRDVLSYLPEHDQRRVVRMIEEKSTPSTVIICGSNEDLRGLGDFVDISIDPVRAFTIG